MTARGAEKATVPCTHCGLPVARAVGTGAATPGTEEQRAHAFCCSGCCVAHHLSVRGVEGAADRMLARVVLSAFLAMGVMVFSLSLYGSLLGGGEDPQGGGAGAGALQGLFRMGALALSTPVLYLIGLPLLDAVASMRRWLSADGLILLGTFSAWSISTWNTLTGGGEVYFETATMVLVLVGLGRWLDARAKERARRDLALVLPERARALTVVGDDGEHERSADEVAVGELVRVRPGEVVGVDGLVIEGRSFVDSAALTGEEEPESVRAGGRVLAGSTALDGTLLVRAEAVGGGRVRDEIERLLAEATGRPGGFVRLADRLAARLIPLVVAVAAGAAIWSWRAVGPEEALLRALSVVLISCPCALGIATPLAFWGGLGRLWREGVLVRGADVLEQVARARRVFLDKTGTLTSGELELRALRPLAGGSEEALLRLAAALELGSEHPVGRCLRREWARRAGAASTAALPAVEDFRALPGRGVEGRIAGELWTVRRAEGEEPGATEGAVLLLRGAALQAELRFGASPRPEAAAVVAELRRLGLEPRVLTGDGEGPARRLGEELGVPVEAGLLPDRKVERVLEHGVEGTLFVGDGLNDAAALAAAEVGVAIAGGSARSMDVADVNLLRSGLGALPELVRVSRGAVRLARQNLAWAFGYNVIGLWLAATGRLTPVFAAAAMVLSSLAVVLNSSRLAHAPGEGRGEREGAFGAGPRPSGAAPAALSPPDAGR